MSAAATRIPSSGRATPYTRARNDAYRFSNGDNRRTHEKLVDVLEKLYELEEDVERFGQPADLVVTTKRLEDENERLQEELSGAEEKIEKLEDIIERAKTALEEDVS